MKKNKYKLMWEELKQTFRQVVCPAKTGELEIMRLIEEKYTDRNDIVEEKTTKEKARVIDELRNALKYHKSVGISIEEVCRLLLDSEHLHSFAEWIKFKRRYG